MKLRPQSESLDPQELTRQTALYCAGVLDWRLVPMQASAKKPHPEMLPSGKWSGLRSKRTTERVINSWFERDPKTGIAVITGQASGGLVCIDVDDPKAWPQSLPIPPSPQVTTPRGFRSFFRSNQAMKGRKLEWGEVLFGTLAILPQSIHPNGDRYTWGLGLAPWEVEVEELPSELTTLCHKRKPTKPPSVSRTDVNNGTLDGDRLRELYSLEQVVKACAQSLGIPSVPIGSAFRCILPGHDESTPSASLYRADNGIYVYHDWHQRECAQFLTLAEVRASIAYKQLMTFKDARPELATWGIRLLTEAGILAPCEVQPLSLPRDAPMSAIKVAKGFRELLSCRWLYTPFAPAPFSRRFASAWCGMGGSQAGEGLTYLRDHGILRIVDRIRSIPLYLGP